MHAVAIGIIDYLRFLGGEFDVCKNIDDLCSDMTGIMAVS
jgi:hypothetical protein